MKKICLITAVVVAILSFSMCVSAQEVTAGGFYDISTVDNVSIIPESSDTPVSEISVDVDDDGDALAPIRKRQRHRPAMRHRFWFRFPHGHGPSYPPR